MGSSAKAGRFAGFFRDRRGNITPLMVIVLIPLLGAFALAAEVSGWHTVQRSMQNAADAAAVAAATNASATVAPTYGDEAKAVATRFGYTNGVNNTLVTALNNQTCPSPSTDTNCYKVTISRDVSLGLTRAVGFAGNQSSGTRERVVASAMAKPAGANQTPCIYALGPHTAGKPFKDSFLINGGSNFDLGGCPVLSNGDATCNGGGGGIEYGIGAVTAAGTIKGLCGPAANQTPNQTAVADPYAKLSIAANIPDSTGCLPLVLTPGTTLDLSTNNAANPRKVCGAPTWGAGTGVVNVTTAPGGSVLIIGGGQDLTVPAGVTVKASPVSGSGLTVVFSGTAGTTAPGFVKGNGTVDWGGPDAASGSVWEGAAVYQDARMTGTSSQTYSGNSPTFNLTGLVYAPKADIDIRGAINHQTSGLACLVIASYSFSISGTGSLFATPTIDCERAGVIAPDVVGGVRLRPQLVQ